MGKFFFHSVFDAMYFGYTATTKLLAYMKLGCVLTMNKNSMEDGIASAGEREKSHRAFINGA